MKNSAKIFGRNVRAARQARGLTQPELGERLGGITAPYISRVEHGHESLTIRQCERFAKAIAVPLHTLLTEEK